jgi:hypothetical protein
MDTRCEKCQHILTDKDNTKMKCTNCNAEMDCDYYLEHLDKVPKEIIAICDEMDRYEGYTELGIVMDKLEKLDWTFEFGLDAEPYNLHPIKIQPML